VSKHFTRNTVSASAWCAQCKKQTQHRVDGVKLGPCLDCIQKLEVQHQQTKTAAAKQESLKF